MIKVRVKGLSKIYNRKAVFTDLSFEHNTGVLGISGTNGSGKSTLLKCLAYLTVAQKGSIFWSRNECVLSKDEVKYNTGFVAPYINLYDELTVIENLEFILELAAIPVRYAYINDLIDEVDMKAQCNKLFKSLSTGQQQRIKIASALIKKPDIIFFDEPGSNLDKYGHEMFKKIVNIQKANNKLVIIASNDPHEIKLCDHVITL